MNDLDPVFAALANEHRREMVRRLALRPCSISELADERGLSLPAIHKHVNALTRAGLVTRKKVGRSNVLALRRVPLREVQDWTSQFHPWWGTDAETLENYSPQVPEVRSTPQEEK
jgi:DNA-binding transcriptional ArsR family regulator